ncbi:MAG: 3,4-dihydroxy-2-butanone-4-phosphate synthase, partial [Psychrosphaera sp.]|nr:3,4-dihydroxy-2-butanone-4-phosphate synthase [Psychrosphaera sp.]
TVEVAVAANAMASDIVQPGHIFPLMAQDGGVLTRACHTEAGCDLARMAGLEPSSVIVEILNEDGTMARRPDLEVFAEKHNIKIGTIADMIEYRNLNETTIERIAQCKLPTAHGEFDLVTYRDTIDDQIHFALINGEIDSDGTTLVRVHLQNTFSDLLQSERSVNRSFTLADGMARIAQEGGVLVLLGKQESPEDLINKVKAFELEDKGEVLPPATWAGTSRNVGVGSQILADVGVRKMRLLSSFKKYHSLSGFGLELVEYVEE